MGSHGTGPLRKTRPSGVSLKRASAVLGVTQWDDEIRGDGGKALLHRRVRRIEARELRAELPSVLAEMGLR